MALLKPHARILGPKGLMPNVKSGTLVKQDALVESVSQAKQGLVEFRVNDACYIMNKIGTRGFSDEDLQQNLEAFLEAVARKRPEALKGQYFDKATVKTTMGVPIRLDIGTYQSSSS